MDLLVAQFKWVMLAGGLVTLSMLAAAFSPRLLFSSMLGEAPEGPLGDLLARNWGVLIGLTGGMLIWGALHPAERPLVLVVASLSKLAFVTLVLRHPPYRRKALFAVVVDLALVALFALYLLATTRYAG